MSENEQDELRPDSSTTADEETPANEAATPEVGQADGKLSIYAVDGIPIAFTIQPTGQPEEEQQPSPESLLPPEAQGEANGGPLGCCLGVMIGMLLSLSLAILSRVYSGPLGTLFQGNYGLLGLLVRILMGILVVVFAIVFGSFGWKLGRRFYREYEPPVVKRRQRRPRPKKAQQKA